MTILLITLTFTVAFIWIFSQKVGEATPHPTSPPSGNPPKNTKESPDTPKEPPKNTENRAIPTSAKNQPPLPFDALNMTQYNGNDTRYTPFYDFDPIPFDGSWRDLTGIPEHPTALYNLNYRKLVERFLAENIIRPLQFIPPTHYARPHALPNWAKHNQVIIRMTKKSHGLQSH